MAVMLGLHESNNYYLRNNTSVTRQLDGTYAVKFPLFTSRLTWVLSSLNKKDAAVLKNAEIKKNACPFVGNRSRAENSGSENNK